MDIVVRADQPVKVTGKGIEDKVLMAGQSFTFTSAESLSVEAAPPDEVVTKPAGTDVFDPSNRPNGPMTAGIAPKMPKSGGETKLEPVGPNAQQEVAVAEVGKATRAGGPNSEVDGGAFRTPGPQPQDPGTAGTPQLGAATGDTDAKGAPAPRTAQQVSGAKGSKKSATKARRR